MLNIIEIQDEIEKLENCECTTWDVCKKLAILYTVKEHFKGGETRATSAIGAPAPSAMSAPSMASMVK